MYEPKRSPSLDAKTAPIPEIRYGILKADHFIDMLLGLSMLYCNYFSHIKHQKDYLTPQKARVYFLCHLTLFCR